MPPVTKLPQLRWLIFAWLISWISAVPLFHLHIPDTTDRWSSLQSGGAHTVFTPDLPGEFFHSFKGAQGVSAHLSKRIVNSPEFSLVLCDEKSEEQKGRHLSLLHSQSNAVDAHLFQHMSLEVIEKNYCGFCSIGSSAPRAPPHLILD